MSYQFPPSVYNLETSEPEQTSSGGSSWIWIILLIIFLLIIAGLVVWIVLLYRSNGKDRLIDFPGANISVSNGTTIQANWNTTGLENEAINDSDKVTLYATTVPPIFKKDGSVTNAGTNVISGTFGTKSLSLTSLKPRIKYFATLVATNEATANYQVYTQIVYMDASTPTATTATTPNYFAIEDILQVGRLQLQDDNNNITVLFEQTPREKQSLWGVTGPSSFIFSESNPDICLYANGNTLGATGCSELTGHTGAMWEYNPGPYANRWCIKGSSPSVGATGATGPMCMKLGAISNGSAPVSVTTDTQSSDAWANAFEVPP